MDTAAERQEFAPPEPEGMWLGFGLAILAHVLLVLALMHGLNWQRQSQDAAVEAELWARVPQQAAPREVTPPPPPPVPVVKPPPPPPVVKAPPQPEPPKQRDADIALEREKQKRELEHRKQAELERERLQQQRKAEAKKREEELAKKREEELAKKKEQARLVADAKRKEDEKKRKEEDKKRKEFEAREEREAQKVAKLREDNLRRIQGMAGSGAPTSTGAAAQSSGPSAGWGARVQARVRPNIYFPDEVSGNPEAVVEVRLAPDGTIVSRRIKKSSGLKSWDEAVLRALDKTEMLPRDVDGRVPPGGDLVFRPKG
jgi:colicin import membrane protein